MHTNLGARGSRDWTLELSTVAMVGDESSQRVPRMAWKTGGLVSLCLDRIMMNAPHESLLCAAAESDSAGLEVFPALPTKATALSSMH